MPDKGSITLTIEEGVATVEFYHPKANSLPGTLLKELADAIREAGNHPDARVIILKSRGEGAFCGGASFDEMSKISSLAEGKEYFMGFARVLNAMRNSPRFILARVHGRVVGGGTGLVAASDYIFAHRSASVRLSELSLGIGPFVIAPALRNKMSMTAFSALSIDAKHWYDADWAVTNNLYSQVFDSIEKLDTALETLAADLSKSNPDVMAELRNLMWQSTGHWKSTLEQRAEMSGKFATSEFTQNLIRDLKNTSN
ncbi:MAG: enoyl-CoA hydratase/isomerase family protein [Balneolaceae bacterium]